MARAKHGAGGRASNARKDSGPSPTVRLMILGVVSLAMTIILYFFRDSINEGFLLALLGLLAMVGVFYLFASVIGLVAFSGERREGAIVDGFVESLPEGVCVTDASDAVIFANGAYRSLVGAAEDVEVQPPEAVLSRHDDAANALYRLANSATRGLDAEEEFRLLSGLGAAQGEPRWYRASVHVMPGGSSGKAMKAWRIADISAERLQQEQYFLELQKAIDHLDRAPAGFFAAEPGGRIQYVNATLAEWLGIDLTGFVPGEMTLSDIVVSGSVQMLTAIKADPGKVRSAIVDVELAKSNGESLPVQLIHRVQTASNGDPGPMRTIVLNRAQGADSAQDLRSAEVRFSRFFNSTPMAIAALDADGRILRTNASFAGLFGAVVDHDALARRVKFDTIIHERDLERFEKAFEAAKGNRANIEPFDTVLPVEGAERHVRIFVNAVASPIGGPDHDAGLEEAAIVHAMDTTEQKALEAQMAQSQKMQAVGQLAGGIAHDFNNVLTAIIMASDLLLSNHRPSDPSFPDIMNIKQNANRAASLVRQLLAFSRRQTLRPEVLSLTDVLADLRMLLSRLIGNDIKLTIEHGRDLWPVKADLGQFEQVIVNLTVNARDAMAGGGELAIATRNVPADEVAGMETPGIEPGDYVAIEVADTGTGIPVDVVEKIFEPFFTTKEVGKGTGLGLSMVYGIIKQTGGGIYASSVEGEGTTFTILLPRHEADADGAEDSAPVRKEPAPDAEKRDLSGSATVLLVEDEDAVRMGGVRALTSRGYTVLEAGDGMEALEIMAEADGPVDLVVSDVVMPEMDGPTLLRELRKDHPDIKFIFVSGYAEDAFAKNLPEGAQFGFLPKPFSLKQLATKVKETLEEQ
ncbi:MAG: response regulator [Roseitalea sp.]|nr:response regulator [Roseitalea sp.]MBO6950537.1 response regulator [Rhizobiaceae bacterium]MBO6591476.1 response regulator [Roseitalea sp.]MBO6599331.1 response regulator [Roseitalea sp.]MBO6612180.1 response regulator [Roseitalea sp.]